MLAVKNGDAGNVFKLPVWCYAIHHCIFVQEMKGNEASKASTVKNKLGEPAQLFVQCCESSHLTCGARDMQIRLVHKNTLKAE